MKSRSQAIEEVFETHGSSAIYIVSTGYLSRAVHSSRPTDPNIFYMKGSMGLAPGIGLGISSTAYILLNGSGAIHGG